MIAQNCDCGYCIIIKYILLPTILKTNNLCRPQSEYFFVIFFPDKKSTPECSPTHSPIVKTRNNRKVSSTSVSNSNGNEKSASKKLDLVPDGVAPIARTEEMSDDLSEETLVNGESTISEHSKSKY